MCLWGIPSTFGWKGGGKVCNENLNHKVIDISLISLASLSPALHLLKLSRLKHHFII